MRIVQLATLSATLLLAAPAIAQSTTQAGSAATTSAQTAKTAVEEKKVCKRLDATGTRMEKRVCLTKEQWQKVEDDAK